MERNEFFLLCVKAQYYNKKSMLKYSFSMMTKKLKTILIQDIDFCSVGFKNREDFLFRINHKEEFRG